MPIGIQILLFVTALAVTRAVWDGFQIRKELFVAFLLQFAFFATHIIGMMHTLINSVNLYHEKFDYDLLI
jgi:hypothetical protein